MASHDPSILPPPSPDHRRAAAGQFERANQVIARGDFDYGIQLLLSCCKLDPANLIYRQRLRLTEKRKYNNNLRGSRLAWLTTWMAKARLKAAKRSRDHLKVLLIGEQILARNPWDVPTQMDMAQAAEVLGLLDLAVWTLEQARQKDPRDPKVNRTLAALYEKCGNFTQAIALWELVRRADPSDAEAQDKSKDLAARDTIARGNYDAAIAGGPTPRAAPAPPPPAASPPPRPAVSEPPEPPPPFRTPTPVPAESASPANRVAAEAARLRARIDADPTSANAWLHLAAHYRRAERYEDARVVLQEGLGPTGQHFELLLEIADLEIEPFRANLALTEEKLRAEPDNEELRRIRIRLLKEINTRELDLYRQKADRYPTELAHRFEVGLRLLRAGQTEEAIRELQAARSDPRLHWKALLYLGYCFKARNNWRLAKRNFEESLQNMPPGEEAARKEAMFQLAQGAADTADWAAAVEMATELANLDFGYRDIGRLLDEWTARLQQAG